MNKEEYQAFDNVIISTITEKKDMAKGKHVDSDMIVPSFSARLLNFNGLIVQKNSTETVN